MSQSPNIAPPAARPSAASRWTVCLCVFAVAGMIGLTYASAPLYRMFCQVTGFEGTPKRVAEAPKEVLTRRVTVRFDTSVSPSLAWEFAPAQGPQTLKVGEVGLAFFHAKNLTGKPLSGTASFNVTPEKVGAYFSKIECFCFTEQRLAAGQEVDMPVQYFIDPEIEQDENMHDVKTITLSYTFYPSHPRVAVSTVPSSPN
ncbi:MAG: cytochrome c oxidase assembly protein [Alphaproteobacteria bacterium]|nr:cytochrome c oxidase assembly protein [Alphaproteobacteria bacterium]